MNRSDMLTQLRCLRQFCSEQVRPDAHPMWSLDVEALDQALAELVESTWISCEMQLPPEHDSLFAKLYGTPRWMDGMFLKVSDEVQVCKEFENGQRTVTSSRTRDGIWVLPCTQPAKIICWRPLAQVPENQKGDSNAE